MEETKREREGEERRGREKIEKLIGKKNPTTYSILSDERPWKT